MHRLEEWLETAADETGDAGCRCRRPCLDARTGVAISTSTELRTRCVVDRSRVAACYGAAHCGQAQAPDRQPSRRGHELRRTPPGAGRASAGRLAGGRLVSLVGPGGVGKTRLAVRLATDLGRGFAERRLVGRTRRDPRRRPGDQRGDGRPGPPGPGRDDAAAGFVVPARATASCCWSSTTVNICSTPPPRLVTEVLRAAPEVRVIAHQPGAAPGAGEHVLPVPPLALPPAGGGEPLARLRQNEAVALFAERAAAASGTFELTSSQPGGRGPSCAGGSTGCRWRSSSPRSGPASSPPSRSSIG